MDARNLWQVWSHETGEELSLYPYISKEVGNCVCYCYLVLMKLNLKLRKQRKPLESTKWKLRLNKLMEKGVRVKSQRELGTRFTQVVVMWQLNGCKESIAGVVP